MILHSVKKSIDTLIFCISAALLFFVILFIHTINASASELNRPNGDINNAIVRIYSVTSPPSYYRPWQNSVKRISGSGFIIHGNRILTNAHVVASQTFIEVRKNGDPRRYRGSVLSVSHEADLALLTVEDQTFFNGIRPLHFGALPDIQQEVLVYGFPTGGDTLSITKGIVSRIEHVQYSHSGLAFLAGQIDAAINPGNSGGPVITGDRVVGVAMQTLKRKENIGYLIPVPVIKHFLIDIEDGHYDGFPKLGLITQNMENPDMKRKYGMKNDQTGIILKYILPDSPAADKLKKEDIVLGIDKHPIADDGTVEFRPMERTSFGHFVDMHHIGDKVQLTIFRAGTVSDVILKSDTRADQLFPMAFTQHDTLPRYFIFGGLVFSPLTRNLVSEWSKRHRKKPPSELLLELKKIPMETERETVLALHVLAADINKGYHNISMRIIRLVNGDVYKDFNDFYQKVTSDSSPYVVFKDWRENQIVIDRKKALDSHKTIIETYQIQNDRSPDLIDRSVRE